MFFCCDHFSEFIVTLYDLEAAVADRRHVELVKMYEDNVKHLSRLTGTECEGDKEPEK
jgi:hypothetical protein